MSDDDLNDVVRSAEDAELADHVSSILFDSGDAYDPDCLLCKRAIETGAFARYGIDPTEEED